MPNLSSQANWSRYLIADYERSTFSISQRSWDPNGKEDIRTILPPSTPIIVNRPSGNSTADAKDAETKPSRSKPRTTIIIAAAVGGTLLLIILSVLLGCFVIYPQRTKKFKPPIVQNYYQPPEPTLASIMQNSSASSEHTISAPEVALPIAAQFCRDLDPSYTVRSELDAIGTLIYNPQVNEIPNVPMLPPEPVARNSRGIRSIYELSGTQPATELVGSPVGIRPVGRGQREPREYEDYRRKVRFEERVRIDTFMRESP